MKARITHPEVDYDGHRYVEGDIIEDDNGAEKLTRWGFAEPLVDENDEAPPVPEVPEAFDPTSATIVDVEKYVEAHPETLDVIYDAEAASAKPRPKLLASLDARRAPDTNPQEG